MQTGRTRISCNMPPRSQHLLRLRQTQQSFPLECRQIAPCLDDSPSRSLAEPPALFGGLLLAASLGLTGSGRSDARQDLAAVVGGVVDETN